MAVVVGPGRKFGVNGENETKPAGPTFICHQEDQTAATILISLGALGIGANLALMAVILLRRPLRRSVLPKTILGPTFEEKRTRQYLTSMIHDTFLFVNRN